jgi:hypothetical protein
VALTNPHEREKRRLADLPCLRHTPQIRPSGRSLPASRPASRDGGGRQSLISRRDFLPHIAPKAIHRAANGYSRKSPPLPSDRVLIQRRFYPRAPRAIQIHTDDWRRLYAERLRSKVPVGRGHTEEEALSGLRPNWHISGFSPIECYQWFAGRFLKSTISHHFGPGLAPTRPPTLADSKHSGVLRIDSTGP